MKVYERIYDNPLNEDGTKKPNKFFGDFKILQTLYNGGYTSQRIGEKYGVKYLITEYEVSYKNGGSRFEIKRLNF